MAVCQNCGKKPQFGQSRSFSMKATKRQFKPNIQKVKVVARDGSISTMKLCAKCIKTFSKDFA